MSDLVTFLRARLDEQELAAKHSSQIAQSVPMLEREWRVRDAQAKRRIVDEYERQVQLSEENVRRCVEIGRHGWDDRLTNLRTHGWQLDGRVAALLFAVQTHAAAYDTHPDYDPAWRS